MTIDDEMGEIVREFLIESFENLDKLDQDFVELEADPSNPDLLGSVFRTLHTIKGTAGFFGFHKLERLAHVGENLLDSMRDGTRLLDEASATVLLEMVDGIRALLEQIEADSDEGDLDFEDLAVRLTQLNEGPAETATTEEPAVEQVTAEAAQTQQAEEQTVEMDMENTQEPEGNPVSETAGAAEEDAPVQLNAAVSGEVSAEPDTKESPADEAAAQKSSGGRVTDNSLRVDVSLLDRLMNMVGELVLARNQILQNCTEDADNAMHAASQRLNLITTELQEGVMKTRMQPIGNLWSKFPRIVRDVARECGKKAALEMEGRETELDKTIVEAIKDPLTHMVRNSVDHGVEAPEARVAAGKPEEGLLTMRAFHEGGQVVIEIADDGAGIDVERIRDKALSRGFLTPNQHAQMSEREILNLVFEPGLSTVEEITNVSGRGVGMDVVRTKLEKIGGSVELHSKRGKGTTVRVKIPLTLAIVPALMITDGGERFAIPQVSLLELVRLEGDAVTTGIEYIQGTAVYRLRGKLLPLIFLNEQLQTVCEASAEDVVVDSAGTRQADGSDTAEVDPGAQDAQDAQDAQGEVPPEQDEPALNVVVLQADEEHFGLVVDEINDTEEIVVKPLGKQSKNIQAYAGATIRGDGRVSLILDVLGIARMGGVVSEIGANRPLTDDKATSGVLGGDESQTLLLVHRGDEERIAIPLSSVDRLEEIDPAGIERSAGGYVVQYRGEILPLVSLTYGTDLTRARESEEPLQVVVYSHDKVRVGIIVDKVLDIVRQGSLTRHTAPREGIVGTAIIQDQVTDVVDMQLLLNDIAPAICHGYEQVATREVA